MKNHLWPPTTLESKHQTNMVVPRTRLKTACLNHSDKQKEVSCRDQNILELQSPMNIILHLEGKFTLYISVGFCVSTTPLGQWGFQQYLPFSWTTLKGKHCWQPIAVMGVVDTYPVCVSASTTELPAMLLIFSYLIKLKFFL